MWFSLSFGVGVWCVARPARYPYPWRGVHVSHDGGEELQCAVVEGVYTAVDGAFGVAFGA